MKDLNLRRGYCAFKFTFFSPPYSPVPPTHYYPMSDLLESHWSSYSTDPLQTWAISDILEILNCCIPCALNVGDLCDCFRPPSLCSLSRWPYPCSWLQLPITWIFSEFSSNCQTNISTFLGFLNLICLFTRTAEDSSVGKLWFIAMPDAPAMSLGSLCLNEE